MTVTQMLVIAGAFILAGIAKGAIGIGLPPIAIGLMTLALPLGDALAIMTIPTLMTNLWQAFAGRRFVPLLRRFGTMAAAAVVGVIGVACPARHAGQRRVRSMDGMTAGALRPDRLVRLAPGHATRRRALAQSADRAFKRRGGRPHRHGRRAVPALHAVAADHRRTT